MTSSAKSDSLKRKVVSITVVSVNGVRFFYTATMSFREMLKDFPGRLTVLFLTSFIQTPDARIG